ncbi:esterase/lipase family protein [Streptomyces umbrinus]|uniref:esterase/lipase family protein n=1 Tax=Streptomyces umbrinus TaxID=67370 RepID=UPI0033FE8343
MAAKSSAQWVRPARPARPASSVPTGPGHRDAVLVLPGIMGSELVETATGRVLWGGPDLRRYGSAWASGGSLAALHVTDEERAGVTGRVHATRLLRFPAFAPVLRGFEPYTNLLAGTRRVAAHPDAVREFAYDWRLSTEHAAARLAETADDHLRAWRAHPHGSRDARLTLVAHSMGGLVARFFMTALGGARDVRALITLGTPFHGSVQAAGLLGPGRGTPLPLPHRRLRALARTLPGLYELLPDHRCVEEPGGTFRRFTPADAESLGGDRELAQQSLDRREELTGADTGTLPQLRAVVGVGQRTPQSLTLADGTAELREYVPDGDTRLDRRGDGTVCREAATPAGPRPFCLPQTHGALARSEEAVAFTGSVLTERPLGPPLGATELGLYVPDVATAREPCPVEVDLVDNPIAVDLQVIDVSENLEIDRPRLSRRDGRLRADVRLPWPGLYRVEAKCGGFSPVSQLVLAVAGD